MSNKFFFLLLIVIIVSSCKKELELPTWDVDLIFPIANTKIDIYNITNGERFTTYAIKGKAETGDICINGACCHKASIGDKIIICTYVDIDSKEIKNHKPKVIHVDDENKILDSSTYGNVSLME